MATAREQRIEVFHLAIDELTPDPANPRHISEAELEALTRSIREFGLVDPVIARREDRTVIGGHQRLVAARRLGMETVPVVLVDISVKQARLLNLALNKISGSWDDELLARMLADLDQQPDVDVTLSGFTDDELHELLKSLDASDRRERPETFDLEQALANAEQTTPRTKPGDIWSLGEHRLLCGDSTDLAAVERLMAGSQAVCLWTDPPYGVEYEGGTKQALTISNDDAAGLPELLLSAFRVADTVMAPGAVYYVAHPDVFAYEFVGAVRSVGWVQARPAVIVWVKDALVLGRGDYHSRSEPLLYGWKPGAKHHAVKDRKQDNVWEIPRPRESEHHPTVKPLALVERCLRNSTDEGDLVLDPFAGSGTTLVAAERTDRVCYAVEIDPHYCDIVIARWEAFTGEQASLRNGSG